MESLNLAHLHLLLNHLPTIGFAIALGVYIISLAARSDSLKRISLILFFLIAVMAILLRTWARTSHPAAATGAPVTTRLSE